MAGLGDFSAELARQNPAFLDPDFNVDDFQGIAGTYEGISQGADPRFQEFQDAQFALMDSNRRQQLGETGQYFSRRGLGGTSAELNAMNRLNAGFGMQRQQLGAQLGMQQLGRQDTALGQQAGMLGMANQARQAEMEAITAGLQNLTIHEQIAIMRLAAQNAGDVSPVQAGGGLFGQKLTGMGNNTLVGKAFNKVMGF